MHNNNRFRTIPAIILVISAGLVTGPAHNTVSVSTFPLVMGFVPQPVLASDRISGDPAQPKRHFRPHEVTNLNDRDAVRLYEELKGAMVEAYKLSGVDAANKYQKWRKYNQIPFQSATHGRRYINVYTNPVGADYGRLSQGEKMPRGSIIAKDSFVAVEEEKVYTGPLFVMEKMAAGFNYVSGDWRYTMIMPDGSVYGMTKGEGAKRVEFCIGCHLAREKYDHLYFTPPEYRAD